MDSIQVDRLIQKAPLSCLENNVEEGDPVEQAETTQLQSLAKSISKLAEAITSHTTTQQNYSYLDVLEKAQIEEWLLTTHELETILGVKPHCANSENEYLCGGWRFRKSGKAGRDLLCQVFKLNPEEAKNSQLIVPSLETSLSVAETIPNS